MDRDQDCLDSEILQTGKCILTLLRSSLCPEYVRDEDTIALTAPWDEEDYRVGIYLYDIQDYSPVSAPGVCLDERRRRFPPKAAELSYLIFCNQNHRFGGLQREQLHRILNEIVRAVYDNPVLEREDGEAVELFFLREDVEFKIRLWGSFHQALWPAVYVKAAPVLIASRRLQSFTPVEQRDYGVEKM